MSHRNCTYTDDSLTSTSVVYIGCQTMCQIWAKANGSYVHVCQKTWMNDLSCGIRMWAQVSFVLSQSTRLTDGRTDRKALAIPCVALHAVARWKRVVSFLDLSQSERSVADLLWFVYVHSGTVGHVGFDRKCKCFFTIPRPLGIQIPECTGVSNFNIIESLYSIC